MRHTIKYVATDVSSAPMVFVIFAFRKNPFLAVSLTNPTGNLLFALMTRDRASMLDRHVIFNTFATAGNGHGNDPFCNTLHRYVLTENAYVKYSPHSFKRSPFRCPYGTSSYAPASPLPQKSSPITNPNWICLPDFFFTYLSRKQSTRRKEKETQKKI